MDDKQILIEAWKQSVAVQMHFNDLAMRIRAFSLTLIAAILTAQSFTTVQVVWLPIAAALGCWVAFYLMDRWWYHYLLLGAVRHATGIEESAENLGVPKVKVPGTLLGLTGRISLLNREGFPFPARFKVDLYYLMIGSAVLLLLPARRQIQFRWAIGTIAVLFAWWLFAAIRGKKRTNARNGGSS